MFLLIFESIGTSELILIGLVALIVFGPRKLPQIAKTIGKTMADFRKTTQDFKSTWEKEVDFEEEKKIFQQTLEESEKPIPHIKAIDSPPNLSDTVATPEIREISAESFNIPETKTQNIKEEKVETVENVKQNWF